MTGFSEDPQLPFAAPMDKASFLHWVQGREERYEFAQGVVEMQARVTRGHARVANAIAREFALRLDPGDWTVLVEGFGVDVGEGIRYPDVLVERAGGDTDDLTTDQPLLLAEVLSPSSMELDMRIKPAEYTSLPSLLAYVVASQDEAKLWLWLRDADTGAFPAEPQVLSGPGALLAVPALTIAIPVDEIYRGLLG